MALQNTHYGADYVRRMLGDCKSIFFIGIGGISMSSLARISALAGYRVGGSDRVESQTVKDLKALGIEVFLGHDASHVSSYDAIVYTVAIEESNPEYLAAREAGKLLLSRADYLGYLMMHFDRRVGVSGMHGKSTCTAMCASVFAAEADPTVLCGAELAGEGSSCMVGKETEHFVFEACEYMDSFLDFNPTLAIVLNIGMDHVDYFHSIEQIRASFLAFANRTGENGTVLYNADDAESEMALAPFKGTKYTFGLSERADFRAKAILQDRGKTEFDLYQKEKFLCHVCLPVCGIHVVYNALAASGAALLCGLSANAITKGLAAFGGAKRRMERKGSCNGAVVYDDYAHHPDEIVATLQGARQMGYRRILCAYQPHTYSRTVGLFEEFSEAFGDADRVFFADIYAAREENVWGISSGDLAERIGERATYCGSFENVANAIRQEAREGDLVIVMGAGDIFKVFDMIL